MANKRQGASLVHLQASSAVRKSKSGNNNPRTDGDKKGLRLLKAELTTLTFSVHLLRKLDIFTERLCCIVYTYQTDGAYEFIT